MNSTSCSFEEWIAYRTHPAQALSVKYGTTEEYSGLFKQQSHKKTQWTCMFPCVLWSGPLLPILTTAWLILQKHALKKCNFSVYQVLSVLYLQSTASSYGFICIQCSTDIFTKEFSNPLFDSRNASCSSYNLYSSHIFHFKLCLFH